MEHRKSNVIVYSTENYKLFRIIEGNRKISQKKIKNILADIESGNDILDKVPILVREERNHLAVLDGQHRLEVARQLKRPVHYIIHTHAMSLYGMARVNSNTEKWKWQDFINCYQKAGNPHYARLLQFHQKYKISIGICLKLLSAGSLLDRGNEESLVTQFQRGDFIITKWKEAVQLVEICKRFEANDCWKTRSFIMAICKILEHNECDFDVLLKKFQQDPHRLKSHMNWKGYASNLQEIYNINNSKQRIIY